MLRSFRIGSAFGIPLYINPTFFLLPLYALAVHWGDGWPAMLFTEAVLLAIFGCVLLHELGHALMGRFFGINTRDITLYPIGGVARLESTGGKPHEEIAIALAGPAVNLVIVLLLAPVVILAITAGVLTNPLHALSGGGGNWLELGAGFLFAVCLGNLVLLVFNLVPAFPMDGGRVLRALLALGLPRLRATEIAAAVGLVLAGGLACVGLFWLHAPSLVLVSLFVAFAGQLELAAMRQRQGVRRVLPIETEVMEPIVVPRYEARPFTGLAFDRERGVWVRWVNGVPLD
jgi:Zn-dependent protease